jgi:hypothetical protein
MLESLGSNFKEQSSKFRDGIAGGDGGFQISNFKEQSSKLESPGSNFKEQSSKFRDGIAGGDEYS